MCLHLIVASSTVLNIFTFLSVSKDLFQVEITYMEYLHEHVKFFE